MKANKEGNADIEVCIPVSKETEKEGEQGEQEQGFKSYKLRGGIFAKIIHKGKYQDCGSTYEKLFRWIAQTGKKLTGFTREVYLNDPNEVPEKEILTEILAPIQKAQKA